jgi:hypothetical protein
MTDVGCYECNKKITAGIVCAIQTIDGALYFHDWYCSTACVRAYVNRPHIFGTVYVNHFYAETTLAIPQPHMSSYEAFIEAHQHTFLGPVAIKPHVQMQNAHLSDVSNALLGRSGKSGRSDSFFGPTSRHHFRNTSSDARTCTYSTPGPEPGLRNTGNPTSPRSIWTFSFPDMHVFRNADMRCINMSYRILGNYTQWISLSTLRIRDTAP